jgi:ATP-dependent Zn protease
MSRRFGRYLALWIVIGLLMAALFSVFEKRADHPYSEFIDAVEHGQVRDVTVRGKIVHYTLTDDRTFATRATDDPGLIDRLAAKNVSFEAAPGDDTVPTFRSILIHWFPMLLLIAVWIFFMRQMQQSRGRADPQSMGAAPQAMTAPPFVFRRARNLSLGVIVGVLLVTVLVNLFLNPEERHPANPAPYSDFLDQVDKGQVVDVTVRGKTIRYTLIDRRTFSTQAMDDPRLIDRLAAKNVSFQAEATDNNEPSLAKTLIDWIPLFLLIAIWLYFMWQMRRSRRRRDPTP